MKPPSISAARQVIRYVVIPLGGLVLITIQTFLPGERPYLILAACAMMGYPAVAFGGQKLDERAAEDKDPPPKEAP